MKHSKILEIITKKTGKTPTQQEFANILEIPKNTIGARAYRDKDYSNEELLKIGKHYNINLLEEYLIDMGTVQHTKFIEEQSDTICANYYPDVNGSCGTGLYAGGFTEKISIPKSVFCASYNKNKTYFVVNAEGNSMIPTILSGDKVVIEQSEFNTIEDDKVYLFAFHNKIYLKRLIMNINELVIKSDNPDKDVYKTQYLQDDRINEIKILGKVVGLMRAC